MEHTLSCTAVFEETFEDSNESNIDATSETENSDSSENIIFETTEEYNNHLHKRIQQLRKTIQVLKKQLQDERDIWKREIEERRKNDYINRTAEIGFYYTDSMNSFTGGFGSELTDGINSCLPASSATLEADFMAKYSDNMLRTHYENRQNLQKQIAMANYKRRLLEVENMCNLELLRVKQSVQILQPLQTMCSEWKFPDEAGDFTKDESKNDMSEVIDVTDEEKLKNRPSEVAMPLELIAQKIEDDENLLTSETIPLEMTKSQPSLSDGFEF